MSADIRSGEARPVEYARIARELGGEEWEDLDPGILISLFEAKYGELDPLAEARLAMTQEVSGPPPCRSLHDPWLFEKLVCAFSGILPDFEVWQQPTTEDLVEAMTYLRELLGEDIEQLPEEVWRYIGACLLTDGCWCPPPELEKAEEPIRQAMSTRGHTLPTRAEVQQGTDLDAVLQKQIWSSAASRLR